MLFQTPALSDRDKAVLQELGNYRRSLRSALRQPRRWTGNLRRNLQARAIRGSNTIEGYEVSLDNALAAVDEEEPLDVDRSTWAEIVGYRNAMSYVQQLSSAPHFEYNATLLSSLHYMMLSHDLTTLPGHFRPGPIYVHDDDTGENVYEGPNAELVPGLVGELIDWLKADHNEPMFVRAAMAHLNLVTIHPFKDGNGRMARALQTLVLARYGILAPEFSSIEEYLGNRRNTQEYYAVLAQVGGGSWKPGNDASPWVSFNLRAHSIQAQTVLRRVKETRRLWGELEALADREALPERTVPALYDAAVGFRVRRSKYEADADVEPGTAGRDLRRMVDAGLLIAQGQTRGRHYIRSERLRRVYEGVRTERPRVVDPYYDDPEGRVRHATPGSHH
jgi:Fic family protein